MEWKNEKSIRKIILNHFDKIKNGAEINGKTPQINTNLKQNGFWRKISRGLSMKSGRVHRMGGIKVTLNTGHWPRHWTRIDDSCDNDWERKSILTKLGLKLNEIWIWKFKKIAFKEEKSEVGWKNGKFRSVLSGDCGAILPERGAAAPAFNSSLTMVCALTAACCTFFITLSPPFFMLLNKPPPTLPNRPPDPCDPAGAAEWLLLFVLPPSTLELLGREPMNRTPTKQIG